MRISDWSSDVCSSDLSEMFEFQHPHHIFELLQRGVGHGVEGLFDRWINVQRAKNVNMCVDRAGRHFERGTFQRVRWTGWVSNPWIGYICGKLRDYAFCHCLHLDRKSRSLNSSQ